MDPGSWDRCHCPGRAADLNSSAEPELWAQIRQNRLAQDNSRKDKTCFFSQRKKFAGATKSLLHSIAIQSKKRKVAK